jgi:hypothetical protein
MATALLIQRELQQVFLYKRTHLRACSFIQISGSDDRGKKFPRLSRIDERNSQAKFDFSLDPKFLNFPLNPSQKLLVDKLSSSNAREKKLWWHFFFTWVCDMYMDHLQFHSVPADLFTFKAAAAAAAVATVGFDHTTVVICRE